MGFLVNALALDAEAKAPATTPVAVHAKKDYNPAKGGFVALSKQDVESKRRSAYAYAF